MGYTLQKLFQAVTALVSDGSLAARLHSAGMYLAQLQPKHHFPDFGELRERFARVMATLTAADEEVPGEGRIAASARALSEADATRLAEEIVSLFLDVAQRDPWNMYHKQVSR